MSINSCRSWFVFFLLRLLVKLILSNIYLQVYLMISVYNESLICDCDGAEILRPRLFVVVCEHTSIHDDILSRLGLVVGLGTVLVLFFYCIFLFPMYVKRPKITTRLTVPCWRSGAVFVLCLLSQRVTGSNPAMHAIIFLMFFFQLLFTSFL